MEHFKKLNSINVNENTEQKKTGNQTLTYLSWAWAWAEVKKVYPNASYEIKKFENNLPYVYDEKTGYMVFTSVTIEDMTHEMWLPVMDGANKTMKTEPYTYQVNKYTNGKLDGKIEKTVESATMFDINKTIMRCLTKNLAMFGLGLYIYAGEDLPEEEKEPVKTVEDFTNKFKDFNNLEEIEKEIKKKETLAEYNKYSKEDKEVINKFLADKKQSLEIKI
ncbi:MAG: hypothetical protein BWY78_00064 [Alphaproteobacteria bacterium ADurb.Bin438]|nr:MAG: hypothetical protein BWY78_00064 [Alphaproteobacteria bacterium ADurb.Bin438]